MSSPPKAPGKDPNANAGRGRRWPWLSALVVLVVGLGVLSILGLSGEERSTSSNQALFEAKRGPMTISVSATGDLSSQEATIIRNTVDDTTILTLVDQGTTVKKGDILARLDASSYEDERDQLLLDVENAQAEKITAEQSLEITKQQNESNILTARVEYELAKLDFRKYLGARPPEQLTAKGADEPALPLDGNKPLSSTDDSATGQPTNPEAPDTRTNGQTSDYQKVMARIRKLNGIGLGQTPEYEQLIAQMTQAKREQSLSRLLQTENADFDRRIQQILNQLDGQYKQNIQSELNTIRIAQAELKRAVETLAGSIRLERKGYITETELEADKLEVKRLLSELQQARGSLRLTRQFTFQRELANLRNQLEQTEFALNKARAEARSNLVEAEANLKSKTSRLKQLRTELEEAKEDIKACTVRAPKDGVVVYVEPDHSWDEMISEGAEVDDRQKMFRLPSSDEMVATVNLHQSVVDKVSAGMPARITTSGQDRTFSGEVRKVNRLPDTSSRRRAANQKIYKCEIVVDSRGQLRPGMSVQAKIIVDRFDEATYVPVQSVVYRNGESVVYTPGSRSALPQTVQVGASNSEMIRITNGLKPGQRVLLTPPLADDSAPSERSNRPPQRAEASPDGPNEQNAKANNQSNRQGQSPGRSQSDQSAGNRNTQGNGNRSASAGSRTGQNQTNRP
jgi:HlyD family secretion protein